MKNLFTKNTIIGLVVGLVLGLVITGVAIFVSAPKLMMLEDESKYSFDETVANFNVFSSKTLLFIVFTPLKNK